MKNVILALIALVSVQSFATSPVMPQENSLIELRKVGGMPVPGGLRFRHLWITDRGEVFVNESYYGKDRQDMFEGGIEREYLVGHVTAAELSEITRSLEDIKGGQMTKSHSMPCMDAPAWYYGAVKNNTVLPIFSTESCRDSQLVDKNQRPAANILKAYLQAWDKAIR